jgi:hypothetical protein
MITRQDGRTAIAVQIARDDWWLVPLVKRRLRIPDAESLGPDENNLRMRTIDRDRTYGQNR